MAGGGGVGSSPRRRGGANQTRWGAALAQNHPLARRANATRARALALGNISLGEGLTPRRAEAFVLVLGEGLS